MPKMAPGITANKRDTGPKGVAGPKPCRRTKTVSQYENRVAGPKSCRGAKGCQIRRHMGH